MLHHNITELECIQLEYFEIADLFKADLVLVLDFEQHLSKEGPRLLHEASRETYTDRRADDIR